MNKYADLHLHVSLKHYVNKLGDIWYHKPFFLEIPDRSEAEEYTQSDVTSLIKGNVDISVVALYPLEGIVSSTGFGRFVATNFFGFDSLAIKRLRKKFPSNFELLNHERKFIQKGPFQHGNKTYVVTKSKADFNKKGAKLVFSIEGGHSFFSSQSPADSPNFEHEILHNLKQVKNWEYPAFMLTLCHFEYNHLADQAWAIPLPGVIKPFIKQKIIPKLKGKGDGIADLGQKVIALALDKSKGKRILIDLKHCATETRQQYYKYLKEENLIGEVPVIASHLGVSGIKTFKDQIEKVDNEKANEAKHFERFNPWGINLCDEDLQMIIGHKNQKGIGGMIGISLDQRIVGSNNKSHLKSIKRTLRKVGISRNKKNCHSALFLDNIFHIVSVTERKDAWNMICLSSDNDGIIDPIDACPTAVHLQSFEQRMNDIGYRYLSRSPYAGKVFVTSKLDFEKKLRDVLYNNLKSFVIQHFPTG